MAQRSFWLIDDGARKEALAVRGPQAEAGEGGIELSGQDYVCKLFIAIVFFRCGLADVENDDSTLLALAEITDSQVFLAEPKDVRQGTRKGHFSVERIRRNTLCQRVLEGLKTFHLGITSVSPCDTFPSWVLWSHPSERTRLTMITGCRTLKNHDV